MIRRHFAWAFAALAVAAPLAGCGSSSSSSTTASSTSPLATTSSGATPAPSSSSSAIQTCLEGVKRLPSLKADTRERLEAICHRGGNGDSEEARKAAVEACEQLVEASPLPAGAAKDKSLAACKNAGGTKKG
jgi:hypothetical protein